MSRDGLTAVAADPDRDRVWIVALQERKLRAEIPLEKGDEPGRVVEDAAGRFHVALRRGGAVVSIDASAGTLADRRAVCPAPRGIAYDEGADALHVACLGGELVTLPAGGGAATRRLQLQRDLRDIVVRGDRLLVSTFRSAELLSVNADGTIAERAQLPGVDTGRLGFKPNVAWRMIQMPTSEVLLVHQRAMVSPVVIETGEQPTTDLPVSGGYDGIADGACGGAVVQTAVSTIGTSAGIDVPEQAAPALINASLPVDIAISPQIWRGAVVSAGKDEVLLMHLADITGIEGDAEVIEDIEDAEHAEDIGGGGGGGPGSEAERTCLEGLRLAVHGEPIAVAFAGSTLVVQSREPARVELFELGTGLGNAVIDLPGESVKSAGHEMFHKNENGSMVCASCHPEGGDDGHTWNFDPIGARRTQVVSGGILKTAPFHWDGDMSDLTAIMREVFERRMNGPHFDSNRVAEFAAWIDSLPAPPVSPAPDAEAVARGEALFHDEAVDCARCHAGAQLTSNTSFNVGTGKAFQIPSLVRIGARAPYMHDGCAKTLKDRFVDTYCGGGEWHGKTSHLSSPQIDDLVAYLETL
ncbi:c-type cytochrome [Sorangium cellulosum]|uniref:c-type cytochrome n=1 Tax=Sorangium cellulosum TaxID=56 RepID=UPI001F3B4B71|nr:c-type cytochrome [Sorangium cellulosum]